MTEEQKSVLIEKIQHELGNFAESDLGLELQHYALRWLETEDHNWIDLIAWRLHSEGKPIPPTLQKCIGQVAHARLLGEGTRAKASHAFREHTAELEMMVMASFIGLYGHDAAANLAAQAVAATCGYSHLSSTISKRYPKFQRSTPIAQALTKRIQLEAEKTAGTKEFIEQTIRPLKKRQGTRR